MLGRDRARRSASQPRVVAFFGLFGVGNIGNEASLASAVSAVRRSEPTAELVCVCARPDVVEREHHIVSASIGMAGFLPEVVRGSRLLRLVQRPLYEVARWSACYRFLRRVDLVVVPGTGILDDFGMRPWQMPYDLFRWSLAARLARTRLSFVSVGAGPITHPVSRRLMRQAVRHARYCSVRDEGSRSFMASLGVAADTPVRPDVVFALPRPDRRAVASTDMTIGLGMMAYFGWANDPASGGDIFRSYVVKVSDIACRLLADGHSVRILVGEGSDEDAVAALLDEIEQRRGTDDDGRVIVEPIESMDDLLAQINLTDAVIGTRYHNVIGALMMERPVVSVGYSEKFVDVMSSFALGAYCHNVEDFEPDAVLADLGEVVRKWAELAPRVEACNEQYIRELGDEFELVIHGGRSASEGDPEPHAQAGTRNGTT